MTLLRDLGKLYQDVSNYSSLIADIKEKTEALERLVDAQEKTRDVLQLSRERIEVLQGQALGALTAQLVLSDNAKTTEKIAENVAKGLPRIFGPMAVDPSAPARLTVRSISTTTAWA